MQKDRQGIGVYVHIPFCVKKCRYCDFCSSREDAAAVDRYIDALIAEIRDDGAAAGKRVASLYFGGGTPSFVDAAQIARVAAALEARYAFSLRDADIEATIEVNPASAVGEKLAAYRALGFNRLSVGCQSTDNRLLALMGRAHRAADFFATVAAAKAAGFENISADVIFGLPEQQLADVAATMRDLFAQPLTHLSAYSLIVEPGTVFDRWEREGRLALPPEDEERAMYETVRRMAADTGMAPYEIANFARSGYASRHNSRYWRFEPYRGYGLGAASFVRPAALPLGDGDCRRFANTSDLAAYGLAPGRALAEDHRLSLAEAKGDFMFLGLRRTAGVRDAVFQKLFGASFFEEYGAAIAGLRRQGLVEVAGDALRLSRRGCDLANQVFMAFV
ncbi:radical SAM family heme chaperone HemW [Pseudoramibacter alactolyticus]|uniref:radical SAM family heme chaperone HemW n=1 Tax=Pseudoramibacter alactolyticus TaxID=113287 RepID=UPI00248F1DA3|nr:radical SAM family heme chaperone HemW [Pseudoramibacter alactolyticus]